MDHSDNAGGRVRVAIKRVGGVRTELPRYMTDGAAGMDVRAALEQPIEIAPGARTLVPCGFAIAIPRGYEAQVRPRSGLALKHGLSIPNAPGTIDSDYRGEVAVILVNLGTESVRIEPGDRVAQLVGWEYHGPELKKDDSLEVLSQGRVYGWNGELRSRSYATTIYTGPKGNYVFNAGTCWWNMVLSSPPGFINPPKRYFWDEDGRIQRITKNVLDRMIALQIESP